MYTMSKQEGQVYVMCRHEKCI